jgi:glutathione synthase/RimK-type ligase-like ATP-grasp enzyme
MKDCLNLNIGWLKILLKKSKKVKPIFDITSLNKIKLAIHHHQGSFSDRWIEYCQQHSISYKLVDCTQSDIIEQLKDFDGLMWHWGQTDYRHQLFARHLTYSLEKMGVKLFPNSDTCWHFDDKVGQKYLLESLHLPLVETFVFYTKNEALDWVKEVTFPKVFKLKGGAGSVNVSLINTKKQAIKKINIAFGKGFPAFSRRVVFKEKIRKFIIKKDLKSLTNLIKSTARLFMPNKKRNLLPREKGYIYFQEFIPNNDFDVRINVIGDKCFATRRFVRKNDFRASGSGNFDRSPDKIDKEFLKTAFLISEKTNAQTLALDLITDNGKCKVIEISYGFPVIPSDGNPGYWDKELNWHEGLFKSQYWMIENFIQEIINNKIGN